MSSATIAFQELLRSLTGRAWALAGLAVVCTALTTGGFVVVSLVADPAAPPMQTELYAVPEPALSQEEIGGLYDTLRADPDIAQARYRFGPPPDSDDNVEGHFVLALRVNVDPDAARSRLQSWSEVQAVIEPETSPNAARVWLSGNSLWVGLGLALLAILTIIALFSALRQARLDFAGPIDLLQMAGASPPTLRGPFILLGALYGIAAIGGFILCSLAGPLVKLDQALASLAPALRAPLTTFGLRGLMLGVAVGLIFSGIGGLSAPVQRYPKPLSRSRISASSSDVSAPSPATPSADEPSSEASPSE